MRVKKFRVQIPGEISDVICGNAVYFEGCSELLSLCEKSISRVPRTSFERKWTLGEINMVVSAIQQAQSDTNKYPNKSGKEYELLSKFATSLESARNS